MLDSPFLDIAPELLGLLSMKKPGCLGWGRIASSFVNVESTLDIIDLSSGNFWTHSKATWMHLKIWDLECESSKHVNDSSKALPSFHNNHAWSNYNTDTHIILQRRERERERERQREREREREKFPLTCPTRLWWWSRWKNFLFFMPLTISNISTPKLKTSDFTENLPSTAYSGDM